MVYSLGSDISGGENHAWVAKGEDVFMFVRFGGGELS